MTSLAAALSGDPWQALRLVLGDPLHPGGHEATANLLDRAGVGSGTAVLDIGCGAGGALELSRERGAQAVGLDSNPADEEGVVRGDLSTLPFATGTVDVVLGECVLCLAPDLDAALAETRRVLGNGGRLALSDVTVDGDPPTVPQSVGQALCLHDRGSRSALVDRIEAAGYRVRDVRDQQDDLLAMRDRAKERVNVDELATLLGDTGHHLEDGIANLETALEDGTVGYVSIVAEAV